MGKLRLPRKLKKIVTYNCIRNLKLQGLKLESIKIIEVHMKKRMCVIDFKIKNKWH